MCEPFDISEDELFAFAPEPPTCPGQLIGQLGDRIHFRCRYCGVDFNMAYEVR